MTQTPDPQAPAAPDAAPAASRRPPAKTPASPPAQQPPAPLQPLKLKRRSRAGSMFTFALLVLLPTALAGWYYYTISADRYVAEFRYSVRGGAIMTQGGGEGGIAGTAALMFAGDSFILEDYIVSIQALEDIMAVLPIREMLSHDGGDPVRRYDPDLPAEDLLPFWERAAEVKFDAITGITTARISLYRPEDSQAVAEALLTRLNAIVNELSLNARTEMLTYMNEELTATEANLEVARARVAAFREQYQTLSPTEEATIGTSILGELNATLAARQVELRTVRERAPDSPRVAGLEREIESLRDELISQYASRTDSDGGTALSALAGEFEELQTDYEFARMTYANVLTVKQQAKAAATLNQAELVVFVSPRTPTKSTDPIRPIEILKIFGIALLIWLIVRVVVASTKVG